MDHSQRSESSALLSGWLTKRGKRIKNWKRRWFVLFANFSLNYYKCSPDKADDGCKICRDHLANAPSTPTHVLINDVIDDDDALVSAASSSSRRKQSVSSRSRSRKLSVSSPSMSGAGAGGRRTSNSASLSTRRRVKMATRANGAGAGAAAVVPLCGDACGTIDLKEIKSIEPSEDKHMKQFTIELITKPRTWYLAAESEASREEWIQAIRSTQISTWINSATVVSSNPVAPEDTRADKVKRAEPLPADVSLKDFLADFDSFEPTTSAASKPHHSKPHHSKSAANTPRAHTMKSVHHHHHRHRHRKSSSVASSDEDKASLEPFPGSTGASPSPTRSAKHSSEGDDANSKKKKKNAVRRSSEYASKPRTPRAKSLSMPRTGVNPLTGARSVGGGALLAGMRGGRSRGGVGAGSGPGPEALMSELTSRLKTQRKAPSPEKIDNAKVEVSPASPLDNLGKFIKSPLFISILILLSVALSLASMRDGAW